MIELVERYVHQVGRYLPKKERADIEKELRSLIQDQLDDRFGPSPATTDVASVLTELGEPRQMAASYHREQYLVGPDLYPYMMLTLRHVWILAPSFVLFLNIFGALASWRQDIWPGLVVETLLALVQITFTFSAVVVLAFAIIQRIAMRLDRKPADFNPLRLPETDDPRAVDRFEAVFGVVVGILITLLFAFFLYAGGLTLRLNLSDPGDAIPVPAIWLLFFISSGSAMTLLHVLVLWRNRWNSALWLLQTLLEMFSIICLYFVLYVPLLSYLMTTFPTLATVPSIQSVPQIIVIAAAVITLVGKGSKLIRLWDYQSRSTRPLAVRNSG